MRFVILFFACLTLPVWADNSGTATTANKQAVKLVAAARARVGVTMNYDPAYVSLKFPGGDVPNDRGVCTDVVIRALRATGHDLQKLVHEDMKANFAKYPKRWGLKRPDKNIDHRRVPNLQTYFKRRGISLPVSKKKEDYRPGDLVTCTVAGRLPHIMIVSDKKARDGTPLVIHNIGRGTREEDSLFKFPLTGHYRWFSEARRRGDQFVFTVVGGPDICTGSAGSIARSARRSQAMDKLKKAAAEQVTIFPRLHFRGSTGLGLREDPDDFLIELQARICGECVSEGDGISPGEILLGELEATLIRLSRAYEENFDLIRLFDVSSGIDEFASAIFQPGYEEFVTPITEAFPEAWPYEDILLIRRLSLEPIARGHRLGVSALHRFMTDHENGCSLVAIRPRPLQFEPGIRESPDWDALALDRLSADRSEAWEKLQNHFRGVGFQKIKDVPWMLLCPTYRQAPLQELALANTISVTRSDLEKDSGSSPA